MKTLDEPFDTFMKERRVNAHYESVSDKPCRFLYKRKLTQNKTATIGKPFFVQYVKMRGA